MPPNNGVMSTGLWETVIYYGERLIHGIGFVLHLFKKCGVLLYKGICFCCRWLWNLINDLWNQRSRLAEERQRINTLRFEIDRMTRRKRDLERQKAKSETNIKKWLQPEAYAFAELKRRRNHVIGADDQLISQEDLDRNKGVANKYFQTTIRVLTSMAEDHLHSLLAVSDQGSGNNSKQLYSPYGLLLSAHDSQISEGKIDKQMVLRKIDKRYSLYLQSHKSKIEARCIDPSLSLVRSMLTLLPPLLITQPLLQDDAIQDTNRLTWNEEQRGRPLIYYRPVLVYGNQLSQLSVATRGLVGNSTTIVKERETISGTSKLKHS
ncbi:PREDICTED: uncharacterized protein LOC109581547 isoform X1 [Amphimedon queenslandica]|uniref:Uncharacterized protein n=1 Tax=Amphimedon queenslandica TaxID=400682 RepID=A0AAN0J2U2_AMPQE|nr:PREDICTED: uncharacterized protein LOC109581547 isoform X1 [Amphimedon queenslandica]|eukprot:XP_019851315.1 PREDICTED: uncharacterized protein LOC109581547 isoform X1 [Amphimedon queenslandica]